MNLTKESEELHQITSMQNDLQSSLERASTSALYRLERLEEREETKSNSCMDLANRNIRKGQSGELRRPKVLC